MLKKLVILSLLSFTIFTGCSDSEESQNSENEKVATGTPKIEIVENENAREIKVKERDKSNSNKSYYLNYGIKSNYNLEAQPANQDAAVRARPRTVMDAELHVRSPYEEVKVSMMVRKLSKKFIVKCSACHNDYANGIIGPSLLSKSSDQIVQAIADFKSGKKSNPLMNDLIKMMSESEIEELAKEIYEFNKKIKELEK